MPKVSTNVRVFTSVDGPIDRIFRSKGEAVGYLAKRYGPDWQKRRVRFESVQNLRNYDGLAYEKS